MVTPVLLCGGAGTRLWPLSRESYPKQFVPLIGETTLFQAAAKRLCGPRFDPPVIVTNSDFRFIVTEQLAEIDVTPGNILLEPEGRNTAPAILAAALWLARNDPDALMLIAPSDHLLSDADAFLAAIEVGLGPARADEIVTFGITPTHPETAYGYLELAERPQADYEPPRPRSFVEKPDPDRAAEMVSAGRYLWNAGIFLASARSLLEAYHRHAPELIDPVKQAVEDCEPDLNFHRLAPVPWSRAQDISIDYAIMEKADNLRVIPYDAGWSDLGGWTAVWRESTPDPKGVVTSEHATALDCQDTLLRSEDSAMEVVGIGLKNIIAIAMPDAVLVADASRAQDVKQAVAALSKKQARQATCFPKDHRPWGWFESLVQGNRFQVKRIVVRPGAALSLQSHHHRSEHWIVVQGTARVTINNTEQLMTETQSIYIPVGAVHRLENPGKLPVVLIEVQTGAYLGEDDITRFDDVYARK